MVSPVSRRALRLVLPGPGLPFGASARPAYCVSGLGLRCGPSTSRQGRKGSFQSRSSIRLTLPLPLSLSLVRLPRSCVHTAGWHARDTHARSRSLSALALAITARPRSRSLSHSLSALALALARANALACACQSTPTASSASLSSTSRESISTGMKMLERGGCPCTRWNRSCVSLSAASSPYVLTRLLLLLLASCRRSNEISTHPPSRQTVCLDRLGLTTRLARSRSCSCSQPPIPPLPPRSSIFPLVH